MKLSPAAGDRQRLVRIALQAPFLTREDEHELAVRWRDTKDQKALDQLTLSHMRLAIAVASKFRYFGLPMADVIQEANIGLLEAADRFDPDREVRFSTYATWWIRASIQDYVLRNWSIVRGGTSSTQKSLFFNLRRLRAKLSIEQPELSEDELHRDIAGAIGVKKKDVALMSARLSGPDASLNAPMGETEGNVAERQDYLVCDAPLPEETVSETIDAGRRHSWLQDALTVLNERELRIVRERRLSDQGETLEALGRKLGVSKERVRQIEARALEKLKSALERTSPEQIALL